MLLLAGIMPAAAEEFEAVCIDGAAVLTWEAKDGAAGYYILKDNGWLADLPADVTTYTDTEVAVGNGYTYMIAATDENGDEIWFSEEKNVLILAAEDKNMREYVSVYKNEAKAPDFKAYELPHYGVADFTADKTLIGGKSMRWKIRLQETSNELKIEFENGVTKDISEIKETGYAQFYIYPETSMQVLPDMKFFIYGASRDSNVIDISEQITPNTWNTVKVPIADMLRNRQTDPSALNQIFIRAYGTFTVKTNFYIQGLGFYDEIRPPKASAANCGIDENGASFAEIEFSKVMDESTFAADSFTAEGFTVTDMKYEDKTATLYFAETIAPSRVFSVNISPSAADTDGKTVQTAYVTFTAPAVYDNAAVKNVTFNKQRLENGEITCNVSALGIYTADSTPQDMTMLVAVLKGDRIIAIGSDTKKAAQLKTLQDFSVTLALEGVTDGCRAEVYLVDSAENGKPLCGVQSYFN